VYYYFSLWLYLRSVKKTQFSSGPWPDLESNKELLLNWHPAICIADVDHPPPSLSSLVPAPDGEIFLGGLRKGINLDRCNKFG
jgi:hypothetical protein